jgi:type IV pilus assembly protein PilC
MTDTTLHIKKNNFEGIRNLVARIEEKSAPSLSVKEQTFFAKRLSFLVDAGVPILESLHVLRDQTKSRGFGRVMTKVIADVSNGQFLAKSLAQYPHIFGHFAINIIKIGESSGILSQNLNYLADELKKKHELKKKMIGALVYPMFITLATIGITILLTVVVFPKIMPVFSSMKVELPLSTRIVIALSNLLRESGLIILLGIVLFIVAMLVANKKSYYVKLFIHRTLLTLPFVGSMIRSYNLANMTRTLGLMLRSGLTLSDALPVTADTTANLVYQSELRALAQAVNRGAQLSTHLSTRKGVFPEILTHMVLVGERSGSLSDTFIYLSELFEGEVEEATKNLSSLIEPIMMIVMGIMVGLIAVSIITPIYEITQHLNT